MGEAHAGGKLALDTEFMGEGRYRTLLCLVQLAVPAIEQSDPHSDRPAHPGQTESRAGSASS